CSGACRFNARHGANPAQNFLEKIQTLPPGVSDFDRVHTEIKEVVRIEAEIGATGLCEAAGEETGNDEKHERAGDLGDDERRAQFVLVADQAAAACAQNRVEIRARRAKGGNDANDDAGKERSDDGVSKDAPVEAKVEADGKVCLHLDRAERGAADAAQSDSGSAAQ